MSDPQHHYAQFLGPVYTWMAGGFEAAAERSRLQLAALGLASWPRGLAVDLGCGSGFQTIPLAEAGYRVVALDFCPSLLAELTARSGELPIRAVHDDLLNFQPHLDAAPALIVCMGDTLPHLPTLAAVSQLIDRAAQALTAGGRLVLSFRDLASHELQGTQRFIPVRSEADRLFTCALAYHPDYVEVNDLLHERVDGQWKFSAGSYSKLRLSAAQVAALLRARGFTVEHQSTEQGMVRLVGVIAGAES